jgi:tRNA-specific 2-thiouridylase
MSGGVDSAVSAYLLQQQGYEVVAGFMKNYADESDPQCTTRKDRDEAIKVAQFLGIQDFMIFDFRQEYEERIINYIYEGYKKGITPNPDILCNNLVKFDLFLEKALAYGFDYVATGHYAQITKKKWLYQLLRGVDETKDQSYFLSGLSQHQLAHALFPVWGMLKSAVRAIATEIWLPNADRKDSQWLCFVGNVPMKSFLKKRLPEKKGNTILADGTKVGEHDGAWFFTIGQSRGLDINLKAYVTAIDVTKNTVTVSYERNDADLLTDTAQLADWHRLTDPYELPAEVQVKIRYRQNPLADATLKKLSSKNIMTIDFQEAQRGIAPGQSIVAYDGDVCIGAGIIL